MKKISILLTLFLILTACSQDAMDSSIGEKGKEVTAHFTFNVAPMNNVIWGQKGVETRTVTGTIDDKLINDIWVVQFDNSGNFMKKEYVANIDFSKFDAPLGVNATGTTSTVYFIANVNGTMDVPDNETAFKTQMKMITNDSQLASTDPASGKRSIPMFGKVTGLNVPASGFMESAVNITFARMVAQVDITYTVPSGANFNLEGVRLCNVPVGVQFLPPTTEAGDAATTNFAVTTFTADALSGSTTASKISFFLPENQRGKGSNTTTEERFKDGAGVTKATYIEFYGHTTGVNGGDSIYYRIYPGEDNCNKYNIVRNTKYNITATLGSTSASDRRVIIPERANCYMLMNSKTVEIPVTRANETDLGVQIPDTRTGWTPSLYWSTPTANLVTVDASTKSKGYFRVTAHASNVGSAMVVATDDVTHEILWSWHIWVDDEDMNTAAKQDTYNGMTWMNRNLGATYGPTTGQGYSVTGGLFFQWGRKDPFLGSDIIGSSVAPYALYGSGTTAFSKPTYPFTVDGISGDPNCNVTSVNNAAIGFNNQLSASVKYPMLFLTGWKGSTANDIRITSTGYDSWGGEFGQPKSKYDPCPAGWRVPSGKRTSNTYSTPWNTSYNNTWGSGTGNGVYGSYSGLSGFPLTGWRVGGPINMGVYVMQWSASSNGGQSSYRNYTVGASAVYNDTVSREYGMTVRCVKDWIK